MSIQDAPLEPGQTAAAVPNKVSAGDPNTAAGGLLTIDLAAIEANWRTLAGRTVDAAKHMPALIFPNPLNPDRYVVLNSGHSFSEYDWRSTNANLYPQIGDYALIAMKDGEVAHSGYFDDHWK